MDYTHKIVKAPGAIDEALCYIAHQTGCTYIGVVDTPGIGPVYVAYHEGKRFRALDPRMLAAEMRVRQEIKIIAEATRRAMAPTTAEMKAYEEADTIERPAIFPTLELDPVDVIDPEELRRLLSSSVP
jgi:hypothetical protein